MRPYTKHYDRDVTHPNGKPTPKFARKRADKKAARASGKEEEILRVVLEALELADFSYSPRARLIQVALLAAQNKHNDVEPT